MKKLMTLIALALAVSVSASYAADEKKGNKLGECSKEAAAKGLKGDERNKYLSACNKGETAPAAKPMSQGEKLGACAKEASAKGLKGDEANKYKSECAKAK